jgi:hypothetical protein
LIINLIELYAATHGSPGKTELFIDSMASLQVSGIRDLGMPCIDLSKDTTGRSYDLGVHAPIPSNAQ